MIYPFHYCWVAKFYEIHAHRSLFALVSHHIKTPTVAVYLLLDGFVVEYGTETGFVRQFGVFFLQPQA